MLFELNAIRKKKINLSDILKPIKQEFDYFQEFYREFLKSDIKLLDQIMQYIIGQKSKKIRPIIVLLTSGVCGGITEDSIRGAALMEILHNATLVHDDIVDGAKYRRGEPTVNQLWKSKISVLVGDYLLSKSLIGAVELGYNEIVSFLSDTTKRMSEGEILQIEKTQTMDIDEQIYFRLISDKTAALFSSCCLIGAVTSNASDSVKHAIIQFGEYLGIAFQIKDDLLDILGVEKLIGKPKLVDLSNNSITLPIIHALRDASNQERDEILKLLHEHVKGSHISCILEFIEKHGGFEYTRQKCDEYSEKAREILMSFPESGYRDALDLLVDYVTSRSK